MMIRIYSLYILYVFVIFMCVCHLPEYFWLLGCSRYLSAVWLPWRHVSSPHPLCPSWSVSGKQRPNSTPPSSQPSSAPPFHHWLRGLRALSAKHKQSSSQTHIHVCTAWVEIHPNTEYIHCHSLQANTVRLKGHKNNLSLKEFWTDTIFYINADHFPKHFLTNFLSSRWQ